MSPAMPEKQWNQATCAGDPLTAAAMREHRAGGAKAVVDADDGEAGGAGGEHPEQGGHAGERGAVAGAGGHRDDRGRRDAADDAGQGALHAGHDHDGVGVGQHVGRGEQAVDPGDADVGQPHGLEAVGASVAAHSSATGRSAVPAVASTTASGRGAAWRQATGRAGALAAGVAGQGGGGLGVVGPGEQDRAVAGLVEQLGDDRRALGRRLAGPVDGLGHALAQRPVVVDPGEAEVGVGQAPQPGDGLVGRQGAAAHVVDQAPEGGFVHRHQHGRASPAPTIAAGPTRALPRQSVGIES